MTLDSETDIWADVNTIRTPAYAEPTEDDVLALQDAVAEAADALAWQISERARAHRAADGQAPDRVVLSGDYQLALLHALRQTAGVVEKRARPPRRWPATRAPVTRGSARPGASAASPPA